MNKSILVFAMVLPILLVAVTGCGEKASTTTTTTGETTTAAASAAKPQAQTAAAQDPNSWHGTVKETMNSGGYTYVLLDTGTEELWAAASVTEVAVGQQVSVPKGMMMSDFTSRTLDRVFPEIYFVGGIYPEGQQPAAKGDNTGMPNDATHSGMGANQNTKVASAEVESVDKVAGGYTIAEIFARSTELSGQPVQVRGQVVKFTANIMGTNWVHIQDGTEGDLTVTTSATVATGDVVLVEGSLTTNKDFGAGYRYDAIIENASVTKQ